MELQGCVLQPPPTFTGFTNLKSLYLSKCTLGNGVLERLISKSTLLESMELFLNDGLDHLKILCSESQILRLCGSSLSDVSFGNTPLLSVLAIYMAEKISDQQLELFHRSGTCPLVMLLNSLPNIRDIEATSEETTEVIYLIVSLFFP